MQSTERKIRQFIKAALLSESVFADDPTAREKLVKLNKYIHPAAIIDPAAIIAGSEIGYKSQPETLENEISGDTAIANSFCDDVTITACTVSDSDVYFSILSSSEIEKSTVYNANIKSSTIKASEFTRNNADIGSGPLLSNRASKQDIETNVTDSYIKNSTIDNCQISSYSRIRDCTATGCKLLKVEILSNAGLKSDLMLTDLIATAVKIEITNDNLGIVQISGNVKNVHLVDSTIGSGVIINCKGGAAYIELAKIFGQAKITGAPQIIARREPGRDQYVEIFDSAQINGTPKISGKVSGNAIVEGNAEVHGLAHITGDCHVYGTAKMISGKFTTGVYAEGEHEGGDAGASYLSRAAAALRTLGV
jgi:hypothetical protein